MKTRSFEEIASGEWDEFERGQRQANILQAAARIDLRREMGYESFVLGVKDNNKIVAGGLILVKNKMAWMPNGPIIDWDDKELVEFYWV